MQEHLDWLDLPDLASIMHSHFFIRSVPLDKLSPWPSVLYKLRATVPWRYIFTGAYYKAQTEIARTLLIIQTEDQNYSGYIIRDLCDFPHLSFMLEVNVGQYAKLAFAILGKNNDYEGDN